jgi:hypothetical protein
VAGGAEDDDVRMVGERAAMVDFKRQLGAAAPLATVTSTPQVLGSPALVGAALQCASGSACPVPVAVELAGVGEAAASAHR